MALNGIPQNGAWHNGDRAASGRRRSHLVTGGAGFIGSHLCDALIARGDEVHVIDDLSTGTLDNIEHLLGRPGFNFIEGSAADPELVEEVIARVDSVYHLAAAVGVELGADSPVHTIETNVHCAEVVFAAAN